MSRIERFACCAAMGAVSCLVVVTVFAEKPANDLFGSEQPIVEAKTVANPAAVAAEMPAKEEPSRASFCLCTGQGSPASLARIEHVLDAPLSANGLDFAEVPLEEVVNLLQDDFGIPIKINEAALEATGLDPTEPVTINLHKISRRSALRLMLESLQLTYIIRDEVLLITSPEDADHHRVTCVYDLRPFLEATTDESVKALMDTIVACVEKGTWSRDGKGQGEIRILKPSLLVVSQTQRAHDGIASLLNAIRKMREKSAGDSDAAGD